MLHYLAGATIQVANLVNYMTNMAKMALAISPLKCFALYNSHKYKLKGKL